MVITPACIAGSLLAGAGYVVLRDTLKDALDSITGERERKKYQDKKEAVRNRKGKKNDDDVIIDAINKAFGYYPDRHIIDAEIV